MPVRAIPEGYHTVTPYLCVKGADKALDFYREALGAAEMMRFAAPDGRVMHAEIGIGDSRIMLGEECPEMGARSPQALGGSPVSIHLYVEDSDALVNRAVAAGAKQIEPVSDKFWGDRSGCVEDPFGHRWFVSTHKEDLAPEEIRRRGEEFMRQQTAGKV